MRINVKLLLVSEIVLLVTVLILVVPVWSAMRDQVILNMQNELKAIASTAAIELDGDLHRQLAASGDASSAPFIKLKAGLARVAEANAVRYDHIYTLYRDGDVMRFGIMLHPDPFVGDPYEIQPLMRPVLERGTMEVTELYKDENGQWISAYAPIRDSTGMVVGLLEVDKDSSTYFAAFEKVTRLAAALGLIALVLSSIIGWLVLQHIVIRPMFAVRRGVVALGEQDFAHRVELKTRDEFEDLGDTINEISSQLNVAQVVQNGLFPAVLPQLDAYRIAATSVPCDATGGDYYDAFVLDDGRLAILVADVSGHGLGPSLLMAGCRAAVHALCTTDVQPGALMAHLDALMTRDLRDGRFITMIFGVLDTHGVFTYSNAGHAPAMVAMGDDVRDLESHAPPLGLGLFGQMGATETTLMLAPGDRVFFASDGVNETMSATAQQFGLERIRIALRDRTMSCDALIEHLLRATDEHRGSGPRTDDVTLLCVDDRRDP